MDGTGLTYGESHPKVNSRRDDFFVCRVEQFRDNVAAPVRPEEAARPTQELKSLSPWKWKGRAAAHPILGIRRAPIAIQEDSIPIRARLKNKIDVYWTAAHACVGSMIFLTPSTLS